MNKQIKVEVSGFITEVFIGSDKQVLQYLQHLKKLQESNADMLSYRKIMPADKHPYIIESNAKGYYPAQWKVALGVERYRKPTPELIKHRQKMQPFSLRIKITSITE